MLRKRCCLCGGWSYSVLWLWGCRSGWVGQDTARGVAVPRHGAGSLPGNLNWNTGRPISTSVQQKGVSQFDKRYKGNVCESFWHLQKWTDWQFQKFLPIPISTNRASPRKRNDRKQSCDWSIDEESMEGGILLSGNTFTPSYLLFLCVISNYLSTFTEVSISENTDFSNI
jgi:hypothetical protein